MQRDARAHCPVRAARLRRGVPLIRASSRLLRCAFLTSDLARTRRAAASIAGRAEVARFAAVGPGYGAAPRVRACSCLLR
jgi:hypothetical protein